MEFRLVAKLDQDGRVESVNSSCSRQSLADSPRGELEKLMSSSDTEPRTIDGSDKTFPYAEKKELKGKLHSKIDEMSVVMIQVDQQKKSMREMQKRLNLQERYIQELEQTRSRQACEIQRLQAENAQLSSMVSRIPRSSREPEENDTVDGTPPAGLQSAPYHEPHARSSPNSSAASAQESFNDAISDTSNAPVEDAKDNVHVSDLCNDELRVTQMDHCDVSLTDDEELETCVDESSGLHASSALVTEVDQYGYVVLSGASSPRSDASSEQNITATCTSSESVPIRMRTKSEGTLITDTEPSPRAHEAPHYYEIHDDCVSFRPPAPLPRRPCTLPTFVLETIADDKEYRSSPGTKARADEANNRIKENKPADLPGGKIKSLIHRHSCPDLRHGDALNSLVQKLRTTQEWNQSKREMMRSDTHISKSQADECLTQFVQDLDAVCLRFECSKRKLRREREREKIIQTIRHELGADYDDTCLNEDFLAKFLDLWPNEDRFKTP